MNIYIYIGIRVEDNVGNDNNTNKKKKKKNICVSNSLLTYRRSKGIFFFLDSTARKNIHNNLYKKQDYLS
jgi:hypothetical protein